MKRRETIDANVAEKSPHQRSEGAGPGLLASARIAPVCHKRCSTTWPGSMAARVRGRWRDGCGFSQ
jgi:hypothetical protein